MTTTLKPILLLDVDGVVNALSPLRPHVVRTVPGGTDAKGNPRTYTLHFDNEIAEMIDVLAEHYEIHWATMWNNTANTVLAPMVGLDTFPVMTCNHGRGWDLLEAQGLPTWKIHGLWYAKTPLIPAYVGERRFAWVDDDHTYRDRKYLDGQVEQDFFLLRTDAFDGLTWEDVADLVSWAKGELDFDSWEIDVATIPLDPEPVLVAGESTDQHAEHDPAFPDPLCRECFALNLED